MFLIQIRSEGHVLTFEDLVSKGLRKPLSICGRLVRNNYEGAERGKD